MRYDAVIVGGGAAGLTAAGLAAREGLKVRVLETRERPAKKDTGHRQGSLQSHQQLFPGGFPQECPPESQISHQRHLGISSQRDDGTV